MEERSVGGNVVGLTNTNDFANRITINLFKKKINKNPIGRTVNVRKSARNRGEPMTRKNVKLGPFQMFATSQNNNSEMTRSSSTNTIQNSINHASFNAAQTTNHTSVIDQITNQVTTPFSSTFMNPVSPLRDGAYQSQNLNQVTTVPSLEPYETYASHLQNYQSSQENLNSTSPPIVSRHTQQSMESCLQPSKLCTSHLSSISNETQNQVLVNQNPCKLSSSFQKSLNPCQIRSAKSVPKTPSNNPPGDDLTPLSWLQSLDMCGVVPHLAAPPTPPASPPLGTNTSGTLDKSSREEAPPEKIDYSINGNIKPPYSYAALIGMAMKENNNKMTLSAIYKWIKDHYAYYKTADQSWQNSIRHNLSLNKCFLKVARSKDEPGKGGFWKLDPDYAESLVDGVFKKRRPTKGTPPPTTKCKRSKRPFPYTQQQQIQQQVQKQRQKEQEELQRQREQEEAVRSLLQPVQEAYMPPPTDKPPTMNSIYQQEPLERTLLGEENVNHLKDDFVWSSFLGDETVQDDTWQLGTQEVVTDITQSGDPSTYQVTASPTHSITSLSSSSSSIISSYNHPVLQPQLHIQNLPSFELSPESLGVEEDLFGTPEYSEASNDEGDSLISSLDLGVGLDLTVDTTNWHNKQTCEVYNIIDHTIKETEVVQHLESIERGMMMNVEGSRDLVEFHDFEGNLTQLTALEPVTPVVVQQISQPGWNHEQHSWDEAKTFSLLEANLDFDKLIDLDVM